MRNRNTSIISKQSGAAVVETVIILPFLLVVSMCLFDYGRYLETYWTLEHAAREGLIHMSRLGDMNKTDAYNLDVEKPQFQNCFSDWIDASPICKHRIVHWIVRRVIESQESWYDSTGVNIYTNSDDWGNGEWVSIDISARYTPLIDVFKRLHFNIIISENSQRMRIRNP